MVTEEDLIHALRLDGQGGAEVLDRAELDPRASGVVWTHHNRRSTDSRRWLLEESGLDPIVVEALLAEDTRPRCTAFESGLILILRGVNLNPGSDPEDMVSIRLWIDDTRIVSTRFPRIMAIQDLRGALDRGKGPKDQGDFVVQLAARLIERMDPVIADLDDRAGALEDEVVAEPSQALRQRLGALRRTAITLRRYIASQREALSQLILAEAEWLRPAHRLRLREIVDRVTRYVEDLDAVRERAAVIQDELVSHLSERMNRTMYLLTLVAAIFLPLGLLTGLLGINVGGIPGAEAPWAFAAVCAGLVVLAAVEIWLFRRWKWV